MWKDKDIDSFLDDDKGTVKLQSDSDIDAFLDDGVPQQPQSMADKLMSKAKEVGMDMISIEKHPGLPRNPKDILMQLAKGVGNAVTSPLPTAALSMVPNMISQASGQAGADVARAAIPTVGTGLGRAAGFVAAGAVDPSSYVGGGFVGKQVAKAAVSKAAPSMFKVLANVPEEATKVLLQTEDLFKRATGSSEAIESAVKRVQSVLKSTLKDEAAVSVAKKELGIYRTVDELRQDIKAGTGQGAYESNLRGLSNDQLLVEFQNMKSGATPTTPGQLIGKLDAVQRELNSRVKQSARTGVGDTTDGLMKATAKEAAQTIKDTPGGEILRKAQAKYARVRRMYDSFNTMLKNEEKSGGAEQMLLNMFKSDAPRWKDLRRGFAELEKLSGEPVLTNLFQQFAASHLKKTVGRPNVAAAGGTALMTGLSTLPFNPVAGAAQIVGGAAALAAQSPRVLSGAANAVPAAATIPGAAAGIGANAIGSIFSQPQ